MISDSINIPIQSDHFEGIKTWRHYVSVNNGMRFSDISFNQLEKSKWLAYKKIYFPKMEFMISSPDEHSIATCECIITLAHLIYMIYFWFFSLILFLFHYFTRKFFNILYLRIPWWNYLWILFACGEKSKKK